MLLWRYQFAENKKPKQHGPRHVLEKNSKNSSYFEEENYEIIKIFGGFGQISRFGFFK
jgi:hypothetical protein